MAFFFLFHAAPKLVLVSGSTAGLPFGPSLCPQRASATVAVDCTVGVADPDPAEVWPRRPLAESAARPLGTTAEPNTAARRHWNPRRSNRHLRPRDFALLSHSDHPLLSPLLFSSLSLLAADGVGLACSLPDRICAFSPPIAALQWKIGRPAVLSSLPLARWLDAQFYSQAVHMARQGLLACTLLPHAPVPEMFFSRGPGVYNEACPWLPP